MTDTDRERAHQIKCEFGMALREERRRRGWSLDKVEKLSGLSLQRLSLIERGECEPRLAAVVAVCRAYGWELIGYNLGAGSRV